MAGVLGFLRIAAELGYETEFLGAAVSIEDFVLAIRRRDPEIVGVSYRLTPEVASHLLPELKARLEEEGLANRRFVFGGTPPVCRVAEKLGWFERCFSGLENPQEIWVYLDKSKNVEMVDKGSSCDTQIQRLVGKRNYPLLRHHFGLRTVEQTVRGVRKIAEAGVLDVISIAPDQNAQESFFRPEEMDPLLDGAGGVPVRKKEDLCRIYRASQRGNFPLLRIYSGTRDLIKWAELAMETIHNAWGAIPLCWYSMLDGRSNRIPEDAIAENQEAMRWYAKHGIPLEVNEAHHWSLRDAHDTIAVVMAYLAAYNAKKMGVKYYIAQYMLNSPPMTQGAMDLAKMLAKIELIESLHDKAFISLRQVRAGLLHLSPKQNRAKGQLAASTVLAMQLKPHIIHVVGFCEGDHAAKASDVIESCEIVHGTLRNSLTGMPDMTQDPRVQDRKKELISEARTLIEAIKGLGDGNGDPLTSPSVLARAIKFGILDAPQLRGNSHALGILQTRIVDGAVHAYDAVKKKILTESERLSLLPIPSGETKAVTVDIGQRIAIEGKSTSG